MVLLDLRFPIKQLGNDGDGFAASPSITLLPSSSKIQRRHPQSVLLRIPLSHGVVEDSVTFTTMLALGKKRVLPLYD
jgi:hypothetical protein